jgi:hypothetical protein
MVGLKNWSKDDYQVQISILLIIIILNNKYKNSINNPNTSA